MPTPRRQTTATPCAPRRVNDGLKTVPNVTLGDNTVRKPAPIAPRGDNAVRKPTPTASRKSNGGYQPTRRPQEPIAPWKRNALIAAAIAIVIILIHLAGMSFFQSHLFPNTTVGGVNLGLMTYEEANAKIPQCVTDYALTVTGEGESATLSGSDLGLAPTGATVESLNLKGNAAAWPFELFAAHTASASDVATLSEETLTAAITSLVEAHNATATPASDAALSYDAASNTWIVAASNPGTVLSAESVVAKAKAAVAQWQTSVTLGAEDLAPSTAAQDGKATATTDQLEKEASQLNKLYDFNFTLQLGSSGTCVINRKYALEWVTVDADYNVTPSQEGFDAWFDRLAASLDTVGGTHSYVRADGKAISVSGGTYGWDVDRDTLRATVDEGVSSNSKGTIEVKCNVEGNGYKGPDGPDFGYYADVDITEQHARVYDENDNILWETDVITGWDNGYYDTPTGVYVINSKESPSVLQSSVTSTVTNDDGTTEDVTVTYRHEVSYWMPFISNFIGFHDATWQTQGWGGDLYHYQSTGSGGCVNLPLDKAAELWELLEVGTVVSVHF